MFTTQCMHILLITAFMHTDRCWLRLQSLHSDYACNSTPSLSIRSQWKRQNSVAYIGYRVVLTHPATTYVYVCRTCEIYHQSDVSMIVCRMCCTVWLVRGQTTATHPPRQDTLPSLLPPATYQEIVVDSYSCQLDKNVYLFTLSNWITANRQKQTGIYNICMCII